MKKCFVHLVILFISQILSCVMFELQLWMWLYGHWIRGGSLWSGHPRMCFRPLSTWCHMCGGSQRIQLPLLARYWNISAPTAGKVSTGRPTWSPSMGFVTYFELDQMFCNYCYNFSVVFFFFAKRVILKWQTDNVLKTAMYIRRTKRGPLK